MNGNKHTITAPSNTSVSSSDMPSEDRMRQSLSRLGEVALQRPGRSSHHTGASSHGSGGHGSGGQTARRRFVQDGEVPTTYASSGSIAEMARAVSDPADAVDAAQSELARERAVHAETKDQLKQAQATVQRLQTRLGHMELEMQEARSRADQAIAASVARAAEDRPIRPRKPRDPAIKATAAETGPEPEPEPVKWWVRE